MPTSSALNGSSVVNPVMVGPLLSGTVLPVSSPAIELRSPAVDEVLGQSPRWLVRWGITVIFLVLVALLCMSWLIHYPDVVRANLVIVSSNPPRLVIARTDGRLTSLLATEGELVRVGQPLAFLESTARHEDVLQLLRQLPVAEALLRRNQLAELSRLSFADYHQLGELQAAYQTFVQSQSILRSHLADGFYAQKQQLLQQELTDLKALEQNLTGQQTLQQREVELAHEEYAIQQQLADQKVIAPLDLKHEESKRLNRQLPYQQNASALISNQLSQRAKANEIIDLTKQISEQRDGFLQALNTLQSAVYAWKARYVLAAPVAGTLTWAGPWHDEQSVKTGQELGHVIPSGPTGPATIAGEMRIGQYNLGKVKTGQAVLVKLPSYPFQEYGSLSGRVGRISPVPADSAYRVQILFPAGLRTTTGQQLPFRNGLTATGEIITTDSRLLDKVFYELRRLRGR